MKPRLWLALLCLLFFISPAFSQTTAFTYQGKLSNSSTPVTGNYDFEFKLYDIASVGTGTQHGETIIRPNVVVTAGIFTVQLDFGSCSTCFDGEARYLDIRVRPVGGGAFTQLEPRQTVTANPYAIRSLKAASADSLSTACVVCISDAHIQAVSGNKVTGTVANATNATNAITANTATTAGNVTGIVQVANGGTGSSTKNFVDLSTNQPNIGGDKSFTGILSGNGSGLTNVPGTFKWQIVAGLSQQAQANTGYLATSDAQVTITLPTTVNTGDTVRVSSTGAGGWKIALNPGQSLIGPGTGWVPRESNRPWRAVASSADGSKLVAVAPNDRIYTSTDSGATWTPREFFRFWTAVASSADGVKLVAAENGGQLYTSTDSGVSWTPREGNRAWRALASSADGNKLVAITSNAQIYTSTDAGVNWTARESVRQWTSVASSADGNKLVASTLFDKIYTSTDGGVSWAPRETNRIWNAVASSADGNTLIAAEGGGPIFISTNGGLSWTPHETGRTWTFLACSADASKIFAVADGSPVLISLNGGQNWALREESRRWWSIASSADGNKLVAVVLDGRIYTGSSSQIPTGAQYSAIELLYLGNGKFFPVSSIGTISGS